MLEDSAENHLGEGWVVGRDGCHNLDVTGGLRTSRLPTGANNILVSGATGTGKSCLACALGNLACRHGYRAGYRRMSVLMDAMAAERVLGTYA